MIMAQKSNMLYSYFRFYVDTDDIELGLNQFCTSWEKMYEVGYNYIEYKCFVDNFGGFDHWVGDMQGYTSLSREVGFIDGSPSDTVYDAGLLMGAKRIITNHIEILHAVPPPLSIIIRKLSATATEAGKIDIVLSEQDQIFHPFYAAYDESKIERYTYSGEIINDSADPYKMTMDLSKNNFVVPNIDSSPGITDPEKCLDGLNNTYAIFEDQLMSHYIIFDLGAVVHLHNIVAKILNTSGSYNVNWFIQGSNDKVSWVTIKSKLIIAGGIRWIDSYEDLDVTYRYIKIMPEDKTVEPGYLYCVYFGKH